MYQLYPPTATASPPPVVFTDPPGPLYQAATWVRFACRVEEDQSIFSYQWRGSCLLSNQTKLVLDDPLLDEEGYAVIWVQSTPDSCLDYLECSATDGEGNTETAGKHIMNVTG